MTIKPIDFQTTLPRIPEVGKVQQVRDNMPRTDQEHLQQQLHHELERQTHQVQHSEQKDPGQIKDGHEGQGREGQQGKKRNPEEAGADLEEGAPKSKDPMRGRIIDISI